MHVCSLRNSNFFFSTHVTLNLLPKWAKLQKTWESPHQTGVPHMATTSSPGGLRLRTKSQPFRIPPPTLNYPPATTPPHHTFTTNATHRQQRGATPSMPQLFERAIYAILYPVTHPHHRRIVYTQTTPELLSPRGIYLSCLSGTDGAERANRHASEHATFRTETGCFRSLHTVLYYCTALCRQPREPPTRSLPDCEEEEYLFPTCENRQKTANDIVDSNE